EEERAALLDRPVEEVVDQSRPRPPLVVVVVVRAPVVRRVGRVPAESAALGEPPPVPLRLRTAASLPGGTTAAAADVTFWNSESLRAKALREFLSYTVTSTLNRGEDCWPSADVDIAKAYRMTPRS
ncbi:hypothetical protein THAOC_29033, partial [Thalassiosira oceanica]